MRKKKPYNLARKIVPKLREIHRGWPPANEALKIAKVSKNQYTCKKCLKLFRKEYLRKDHIQPIGKEPKLIDGFWIPTWSTYIESMFSPLCNYQILCLDCHDEKSKLEKKSLK